MSEELEERIMRIAFERPTLGFVQAYATDIVELLDKKMKVKVCDICFTSSWQPCEQSTPNAVKDDSTDGWMVCECCRLGALLTEANIEIASLSEAVQSDHNKAWFDVLLQIVKAPIGDVRDHLVDMVKQDLASKVDLERYTSLEWHMWVDEKPQVRKPFIMMQPNGEFEAVNQWYESNNKVENVCLKWAYLPDAGWNKE